MRTAIVIPTYNERDNVPSLIGEILDTTQADVLVVDDDSPDGTGRVVAALAAKEPRVSLLAREKREGLGAAYRAGFRRVLESDYGVIVQMDADFSHQPRYLPTLLHALENADVAIGSRYVDGGGIETWGLLRRGVSYLGNAYAREFLGVPYRDLTAGFVGFRRHVLEAIDLENIPSDGYGFQLELKFRAHRRGFSIVEVPIVFFDRVVGTSKLSKKTIPEAVWRVAQLRLKE